MMRRNENEKKKIGHFQLDWYSCIASTNPYNTLFVLFCVIYAVIHVSKIPNTNINLTF
jgi:hypothetical protein